jgi:acetyltransferase-like isoleucine patch superfamily enzyme
MFSKNSVIDNCDIGKDTVIWHHCNLYRCVIGDNCEIGSFVEIGDGVVIGDNCKILPYAFICPGVTIGSLCFIGPHVVFCNDTYPTVVQKEIETTIIKDEVNIGAGAVILPDVYIASGVTIGAGSIVTKSIFEPGVTVYGNPAKVV